MWRKCVICRQAKVKRARVSACRLDQVDKTSPLSHDRGKDTDGVERDPLACPSASLRGHTHRLLSSLRLMVITLSLKRRSSKGETARGNNFAISCQEAFAIIWYNM